MTQSEFTSSDEIWPGFVRRKPKAMRLVLIDDHPVVREGICALLSLEPDVSVVGDAGDIETGIELVRRQQPDLVICDLTMPGCTGGVAVRKLRQECPTTRVLVLTAHDSLECIRESFNSGAIGFVRKDAMRADLLSAVRRAASGAQAICRGVGDTLVRNWLREPGTAPPPVDAPLAPDDRQIIRLIALGVPTWKIAADLGRGVKVVEKYRASLMRRLDLGSTAAVARFAIRCNLLSSQEVDQLVSAD
ncbi:MAG TPA: response regulator transcription factor [Steroidobacteraceae bacterium]|jgi:DNA-binding NarL/FixJ family response regulator|nr:response regulator transcription factor [Steroidobacteraceae bacterium]